MSKFNLRRFARVDQLRSIEDSRLIRLLDPYVAYFTNRGITPFVRANEPALELAANGASATRHQSLTLVDHEALSAALLDPDDDMPVPLIDALFLISEMSTPQGMEDILASEEEMGIEVTEDQTPADVATQAFLHAPRVLERLRAEQFVIERETYLYFATAEAPSGGFRPPRSELIATMERELSAWFLKRKKGDLVRVFMYPKPDEVWFLIQHGEGFRRQGAQRDRKSTSVFFRPETNDVAVYTPTTGELKINTKTKGERDIYRRLLGELLFGADNHFPDSNGKYTLEPLRRGAESLSTGDVDGLDWAVLREVTYFRGGSQKSYRLDRADDLFADLGERREQLSVHKMIGAKFQVKFSDSQTPRLVSIRTPNMARFTRDSDGQLVEEWLLKRGFSVPRRRKTSAHPN